jgi:acyl carrier protein
MSDIENELKSMIVETLMLKDVQPQEIDVDKPLFADGWGLDSIDALELAVEIGRRYKVQIKSDDERNRRSSGSCARWPRSSPRRKPAWSAANDPRRDLRPHPRAADQDLRPAGRKVTPTALLQKDLDLDSIDAVDLVVYLQDWTGREVPEEALRAVRTVDDVVSMVETHLAGGPTPGGPPPGAQ